ncbi:MAG: hypothetical protein QM762_03545 [Chryseolinea sp.]
MGAFLKFMNYVLRSEYARIAENNRLTLIPESFISALCDRQGFTIRHQPGLTLHPTRKNYILQSKG